MKIEEQKKIEEMVEDLYKDLEREAEELEITVDYLMMEFY